MTLNKPNKTYGDRIKLSYHFDTDKMLEEFKALELDKFEYYDVIPLRSPAHMG